MVLRAMLSSTVSVALPGCSSVKAHFPSESVKILCTSPFLLNGVGVILTESKLL